MSDHHDIIVVGAGAAGMMAAFTAGRRGRRVLLLDHAPAVGRKVLISGGGRCNFTNLHTRPENFLSQNPHFARSALARYTPADFVALVQAHGIAHHEKTLGQLFCDGSARQIVTMLEAECAAANVITHTGVTINRVAPAYQDKICHPERSEVSASLPRTPARPRFTLTTSLGKLHCTSLIIATGGLSIPRLGATGFGYDLARQFGHAIVEPRPGLVPVTLAAADRDRWCTLSGVSFDTIAQAPAPTANPRATRPPAFRERALLTHRGLSGPAILQASSYWTPGNTLTLDLAPDREVLAPLLTKNARRDPTTLLAALREALPTRLAEAYLAAQPPLDFTNTGLARLERNLHAFTLHPDGTEGFPKAEVTVGGLDTRELDSNTMESRRTPGLYFIGEVVDVTGWLGGYNFQWAWASATAAGLAA